jgi:hypothetical protein
MGERFASMLRSCEKEYWLLGYVSPEALRGPEVCCCEEELIRLPADPWRWLGCRRYAKESCALSMAAEYFWLRAWCESISRFDGISGVVVKSISCHPV